MPVNASATPPHPQHFVPPIRSEDLPHIAAFLQRIEVMKEQFTAFRIDVILDANVVIRDLRWMATKRTNPKAKTELMELIDCQVVRAHAPYFLVRELKENLPDVAKYEGVPLRTLQAMWKDYRKKIHLVPVGGPPKDPKLRDPKDVPYLRLQEKLNHVIVSEDPDLAAMGGSVVRIQMFAPLRSYARNVVVEYHYKVMGVGSMMIAGSIVETAVGLLRNVRNLPRWMIWGALLLVVLALANPTSRKKVIEIASQVFQGTTVLAEVAFGVIIPMVEQHTSAQEKARLSLEKAQATLTAGATPLKLHSDFGRNVGHS